MITVAIIGILAAIAIPSYRDYVLRGQIVEATNGLAAMRANMERHFQDNRTYDTVGSGATEVLAPCKVDVSKRKAGTFTLACKTNTLTATAYVLEATGSGSTSGFVYALNQADIRSTTIAGVPGWNTTCATAWILKKGQSC